ncbi:MAG: hypothetical protein CMO81_11515 [Waddliaceae bacterium]|nr:hypothetical protein [Waddliaceae bacterium]
MSGSINNDSPQEHIRLDNVDLNHETEESTAKPATRVVFMDVLNLDGETVRKRFRITLSGTDAPSSNNPDCEAALDKVEGMVRNYFDNYDLGRQISPLSNEKGSSASNKKVWGFAKEFRFTSQPPGLFVRAKNPSRESSSDWYQVGLEKKDEERLQSSLKEGYELEEPLDGRREAKAKKSGQSRIATFFGEGKSVISAGGAPSTELYDRVLMASGAVVKNLSEMKKVSNERLGTEAPFGLEKGPLGEGFRSRNDTDGDGIADRSDTHVYDDQNGELLEPFDNPDFDNPGFD